MFNMFKYVQFGIIGSQPTKDHGDFGIGLYIGLEPERLRFHHEIGKAWNPVESSLERSSTASVGKSARLHFFQDALTVFSCLFSGLFSGLWQSVSSASCNAHNCTATTPAAPIALPLRSVSLGLKQPSTCPEGLLQEERTQYPLVPVSFCCIIPFANLLPRNNMEQHGTTSLIRNKVLCNILQASSINLEDSHSCQQSSPTPLLNSLTLVLTCVNMCCGTTSLCSTKEPTTGYFVGFQKCIVQVRISCNEFLCTKCLYKENEHKI